MVYQDFDLLTIYSCLGWRLDKAFLIVVPDLKRCRDQSRSTLFICLYSGTIGSFTVRLGLLSRCQSIWKTCVFRVATNRLHLEKGSMLAAFLTGEGCCVWGCCLSVSRLVLFNCELRLWTTLWWSLYGLCGAFGLRGIVFWNRLVLLEFRAILSDWWSRCYSRTCCHCHVWKKLTVCNL